MSVSRLLSCWKFHPSKRLKSAVHLFQSFLSRNFSPRSRFSVTHFLQNRNKYGRYIKVVPWFKAVRGPPQTDPPDPGDKSLMIRNYKNKRSARLNLPNSRSTLRVGESSLTFVTAEMEGRTGDPQGSVQIVLKSDWTPPWTRNTGFWTFG